MKYMTRWAKDQNEFAVSLNHDVRRGCIAIIPKPVLEHLDTPARLKFVIKGQDVVVVSGDDDSV